MADIVRRKAQLPDSFLNDTQTVQDPTTRAFVIQLQQGIVDLQRQLNDVLARLPSSLPTIDDKSIQRRLDSLEEENRKLAEFKAKALARIQTTELELSRKVTQMIVHELPTAEADGDFIICKPLFGEVEGPDELVAKPYLLRRSPFDGETVNDIVYAYSDNYTRTADDVEQTIVPPYAVGDIIYAERLVWGGVNVSDGDVHLQWVDQNADGRHWATASAGGFMLGKVTSKTSGQVYVMSLYGDGSGAAATETGVSVTVVNVASAETLAANTWLAVTPIGAGYEAIVYGVFC